MNTDRFNFLRRDPADEPERTADGRLATDRADRTDRVDRTGRAVRDRDVAAGPAAERRGVDADTTVIDRGRTPADRTRVDPDRAGVDPAAAAVPVVDRRTVVAREREAFGGVKIGSAFFGWLTATGTAVLLTALVAAGGTAVGVLNGESVSNPDFGVTWRGVRGAVVIVAVLLVAYYCGGYVAGRMARFNGVKQGLAVFAWAVVIALLVAALGAIAGTQWNALSAVTGVPRFNTGPARVTADAALVGTLAVAAALVGAVLGGLAGMRFHRRVDRAGWTGDPVG